MSLLALARPIPWEEVLYGDYAGVLGPDMGVDTGFASGRGLSTSVVELAGDASIVGTRGEGSVFPGLPLLGGTGLSTACGSGTGAGGDKITGLTGAGGGTITGFVWATLKNRFVSS
jgi:hypothetical protein